jgi:hypothetical protein
MAKEKLKNTGKQPLKTKQLSQKNKKKYLKIGAIVIVVLLLVGLATGHTIFAIVAIRCGEVPVSASRFAASYSYVLPGEEWYSVGPFQEYYCNREEAEKAGFHHHPWTEEAKKEDKERQAKYGEERKFDISKLDFQFYVPDLPGYAITDLHVNTIHSNVHAFYTVVKDGKDIGQVRELKRTDSYNICSTSDPQDRYCEVIGRDGVGRDANREYINKIKGWESYYAGINIGDTGIIFSTDDDQEALKVFGSMKLYTE